MLEALLDALTLGKVAPPEFLHNSQEALSLDPDGVGGVTAGQEIL